MTGNIFVSRGNIVDSYVVNINEKELKKIQSAIDNYNGKGEILEKKSDVLSQGEDFSLVGKKIEIISKSYAEKGHRFHYCCAEVDDVNIYDYKYYAYTPHKLSQLCDSLLNFSNPIDLSYRINDVINYETQNEMEEIFLRDLIRIIKIQKISIDKIICSDITSKEKRTILLKIKNAIFSLKQKNEFVFTTPNFEKEVEDKISSMEAFNEGFHAQELEGQPFKYSCAEKLRIKKKILSSLPTDSQIKQTLVI